MIPTQRVGQFILDLAERHGVSYARTAQDGWAVTITHLAGDEVRHDPVKDALLALKRAGKVTPDEMASLLVNYLREVHNVRSVR